MDGWMDMIKRVLEKADQKTFSYQCPWLALADELNYLNGDHVKAFPSQFGRLSTEKLLRFYGIDDPRLTRFIFKSLENGYTLKEIADEL